jgi:hypothetical protein
MAAWAAVHMVRTAPSSSIPAVRLQGGSLDMIAASAAAGKLARSINAGSRDRLRKKVASATMRPFPLRFDATGR